jgi:predicted phosphoadenosine phosphosulfate sulfurtransferase
MWQLNVHPQRLRLAPPLVPESISALPLIQAYWPEFWTRIQRRIKGVTAVANHDRKLHKAIRHPGETWEDGAYRLLAEKGKEDDRKTMVKHLQRYLKKHSLHSTTKLHETIPCNACGLSWKIIADIMATGYRHGRQFRRQSDLLHWYKGRYK